MLYIIINIIHNIIFPLFTTFNNILCIFFGGEILIILIFLYEILRKRKKECGHLRRKSWVWMDRVWRSIHKLAKYSMIHVFVNASKYFDYSWRRRMSHDDSRRKRRGRLGIASSNLSLANRKSIIATKETRVMICDNFKVYGQKLRKKKNILIRRKCINADANTYWNKHSNKFPFLKEMYSH